jgi:malonyl-CoA O-methyltransferase
MSGRWLDAGAVRRNADRASSSYDAAAVLQARVREQMIARLDWLAFTPDVVVDLGCGTGHGAAALSRRWPAARIVAVDFSPGMLRETAGRAEAARIERLCADAAALPLPDASVDLVFSSLMLPSCDAPDAILAEIARVLRPRGLLCFSTFGPDTLAELREAWRAADSHAHVHPFADMHDIGDGLVRAGLVEPVLDVSRYTLTYPDLRSLMRDLQAIGAQNASTERTRGLTGRGRLQRVEAAYEAFREDGVLPATYEVVFGQAWGAVEGTGQEAEGEFVFPVSGLGRRGPDPA